MQRPVIFYIWIIEFDWNQQKVQEIVWSIVWKDTGYYLVESFNNIWDTDTRTIRQQRMHDRLKCPRLKKNWRYFWIHERYYNEFKLIGKHTR